MFTTPWSEVDRKIGAGIALCGLTIFFLNSPLFVSQADQFQDWWVAFALLVPLTQLISAIGWTLIPAFWLRSIWVFQVFALFAALFFTYCAWNGGKTAPPTPAIWLLDATVVGTAALVLRWPYAIAAPLALAAAIPLSAAVFIGTCPDVTLALGIVHSSNVIFVMLALVLRGQLLTLSESRATAERLHAEAARTRVEFEDSARFARTVHDEVLSTFSAAIQLDGEPPLLLRKSAATALVAVQRSEHRPEVETAELTSKEAAGLILGLVSSAAPNVDMSSQVSDGTVLSAAAGAVGLAAAEAARNSVRHAGGGSGTVVVGDGAIRVAVIDSGPGFDWSLIETAHFGIRESIVRRIEDLDGGSVLIDTGTDGTTVVMAWKRTNR